MLLAACGGDLDDEWERAPSMSSRRSYIASAEAAGAIYVAGGMVGETGRPLATFQRFLVDEQRWETLSPLPEPVRAAHAAAVGDTIYVVGGQPGARAYAYDIHTERWRRIAPLPRRFNVAAVALDGRVYAIGGFDRTELRDVFVYEAGRWTRTTQLPRPVHAAAAVVLAGEIWLIGGRRGEEALREVWIFDPRTERWREGPSLPRPMELLGAAVHGDEIHVAWESTYQIYDASENEWRQGPSMDVTRHALSLFAVDGNLYAIGGCTTALRDSPIVETLKLS